MPRKRKPEVTAKNQSRMLDAIASIKSGNSVAIAAAATEFNVPYSTLKHRVRGRVSRQESREPFQKLFPASELELVRWITSLTISGYSPTHKIVKEMAEILYGRQMGIELEGPVIESLGKNWMQGFLGRHPQLKTVVGKMIEKARMKGTAREVLQKWFDAFEMVVVKDDDVLIGNVYNMDESGFSLGTINAGKVIINTQIGQRYQANPGRQEWLSVIECICMDGTSISPMILFKGETLLSNWVPPGIPDDWVITCNTKGWTSNEHGLAWLQQIFELRTREKAQGSTRVLIYDGHDSHITGKFIRHCMDHNIKLLILPPHSSHFTQPLDIGIFSPLKHYMSAELGGIIQTNIPNIIKGKWALGYSRIRPKAFTVSNINGSWAGAGLNPFQPRKVIRQAQAVSPSPPPTPLPITNIFDAALLSSSPSDLPRMHEANKALQVLVNKNAPLNSPEKKYINRLGRKAERWQAHVAVLQTQQKQHETVMSTRRVCKSGRRVAVEGRHLLTAGNVYEDVRDAEIEIEKRKNKQRRGAKRKATKIQETSSEDEDEVEILDSIEVQPYRW